MGCVQVDLYGKEERFSNKEFNDSSIEDIYRLLFNVGYIYQYFVRRIAMPPYCLGAISHALVPNHTPLCEDRVRN